MQQVPALLLGHCLDALYSWLLEGACYVQLAGHFYCRFLCMFSLFVRLTWR